MLGRERTGVKRKNGLIRTSPHVIRTLIFPILQVVACTSLRILDNGLRHSPGLPRRSSEHLLVIRMHSLRLREHYQVPGKHSDRGVEVLLKHGSLPLGEVDGSLLEADRPPRPGQVSHSLRDNREPFGSARDRPRNVRRAPANARSRLRNASGMPVVHGPGSLTDGVPHHAAARLRAGGRQREAGGLPWASRPRPPARTASGSLSRLSSSAPA